MSKDGRSQSGQKTVRLRDEWFASGIVFIRSYERILLEYVFYFIFFFEYGCGGGKETIYAPKEQHCPIVLSRSTIHPQRRFSESGPLLKITISIDCIMIIVSGIRIENNRVSAYITGVHRTRFADPEWPDQSEGN